MPAEGGSKLGYGVGAAWSLRWQSVKIKMRQIGIGAAYGIHSKYDSHKHPPF
jgi:hypothetical protein